LPWSQIATAFPEQEIAPSVQEPPDTGQVLELGEGLLEEEVLVDLTEVEDPVDLAVEEAVLDLTEAVLELSFILET
jgi:hypothetical protein